MRSTEGSIQIFWLREHKIYQEVVKKTGTDIDNATKKALRCDAISIDDTEIRKWSYHLFIWPTGTCLGNNIFSGNLESCKFELQPLKLETDHISDPFKKDMNACTMTWTI
eukprot:4705202-Ditylum_brightwellii.AAC.1